VTADAATSPLFVAISRLPLAERTTNRISVHPANGRQYFPHDRVMHYNFGNASSSRFGLSFAGGLTIAARHQTVDNVGDTTQTVKQGGFVRTAF
jgi:hypothetical protein